MKPLLNPADNPPVSGSIPEFLIALNYCRTNNTGFAFTFSDPNDLPIVSNLAKDASISLKYKLLVVMEPEAYKSTQIEAQTESTLLLELLDTPDEDQDHYLDELRDTPEGELSPAMTKYIQVKEEKIRKKQ